MARVPKLRRQRRTNRPDLALVELNGQRFYLGEWGTPEAEHQYERRIAEWEASGKRV